MSFTHLSVRPTPVQSAASDFATFGPVHLNVIDLSRSLSFWRDLIGLQVVGDSEGAAHLGVDQAELVVLHPGATQPTPRGHTGLYHLAIHLPSEAEFARILARLFNARYPNSPTDHVMHWATYLDDPDGIMLELSFETLDRFGHYELDSRRLGIVDSQGRLRAGTAPLDLDEVFAHLTDDDLNRPLPPETRVGHLHLHVAEIEAAVRFYEAVGFGRGPILPIGMAELSARGSFPHRLALNIWQGIGAPPAPEDAAGLRHADLRFASGAELASALERVREIGGEVAERDGAVLVRDPSGNTMRMIATS